MADASALTNILSMLQAFAGKTSTQTSSGSTTTESGSTTTKQTNLSQDTLNGLLKSAMEGNSGLADVTNAGRSAGLYNSTTNSMLTNDLLSRLTTNIAAQAAPTVTTTTPSTKTTTPVTVTTDTPGLASNKGVLLGLGGMSLLKGPIDQVLKGKNPLATLLDGGSTGESGGGTNAVSDLANSISTAALDGFSSTDSASNSLLSTLGTGSGGYGESGGMGAVSDAASSIADSADSLFHDNWIADNIGDVADNVSSAISGIGDSIGDTVSGIGDFFKDWWS